MLDWLHLRLHILSTFLSPLPHIRLWSARQPWAITVSLKGGWGDTGLINQSNFLSLCQGWGGRSRWILSLVRQFPRVHRFQMVSEGVYVLRQQAESHNSRASIFIHCGLRWQKGQSEPSLCGVAHTHQLTLMSLPHCYILLACCWLPHCFKWQVDLKVCGSSWWANVDMWRLRFFHHTSFRCDSLYSVFMLTAVWARTHMLHCCHR